MGPLVVNEIISENTNLFLAFIIGIGFGFVLESSGFSSSRKLAGVFYGYDMVVLKVFFTGAITAMLGLLFFSLFGWVDLNLVYVNPTYLTSAIIGGVIMGAGFIIGGYCPGYQLLRLVHRKNRCTCIYRRTVHRCWNFRRRIQLVGRHVYGQIPGITQDQYRRLD